MNITATKPINAIVYVENTYQDGELASNNLKIINSIPWTIWIQHWLCSLDLDTESTDYELGLRLTDDRQIQALNFQYRSMDKPTDVLAFATAGDEITIPAEVAEPTYLGDIIISLDTAFKQATQQQHSIVVELAWLASHGLLHLLGWDHPDDRSLKQMLDRQWELIQSIEIQEVN
jgi:probable rRNA maturation factor